MNFLVTELFEAGSFGLSSDVECPTLDFVASNPTGSGSSDGSIDMTILGGMLPYTILWESNLGDTIFGGSLVDSTDLQAFLQEGTYYVTVTDGNCSVVSDSVVLSGPSACVTSTPPQNPTHTQLATRMQLDWDAVPQSVACQVQGTRISPAGPTGNQTVIGFEANSTQVPFTVLGAGTTWSWKVRCACTTSPINATGFSATDTFSVPLIREAAPVPARVRLYPNPVQERVRVRLLDFEEGPAFISITDLSGRVLHEEKVIVDASDRTFEIQETGQLAPGMYRMIVRGSSTITEPFVKVE